MFKYLISILGFSICLFANEFENPDLTGTWVGYATVVIFVIGYYFVANEEKYKLDKSVPALFIGIFSFLVIAIYYYFNDLNIHLVHDESEKVILEIAEIFFFLFVAMTYIESLLHMRVFDCLKYNLVSKGYSYKKLFWITGAIAFFLSPIADNLTTALILATVLITIEKHNKEFLVPAAINIVVAANASRFVPSSQPKFDLKTEEKPQMSSGAKVVIFLGFITLFSAIISHQILDFPAMWGMMFGLALLKIYSYRLTRKYGADHLNVFRAMSKIENNTLMFFFGILAAVGALYFVGWLTLLSAVYNPDILGPTWSNIAVGFLSAIVDNVPVMSAVLKANPDMSTSQWMLVTLTAGIGGSLISFGSAAGVGVMGKLKGIYTFNAHMKYSWTILIGYTVSIGIWYFQFIYLNIH